jgi:hypothetical protein
MSEHPKKKLTQSYQFQYTIHCGGWGNSCYFINPLRKYCVLHNVCITICRDCETYFGRESLQPITRDDSVVCETQYSKVVPLEGGEVRQCVSPGPSSLPEYSRRLETTSSTRALLHRWDNLVMRLQLIMHFVLHFGMSQTLSYKHFLCLSHYVIYIFYSRIRISIYNICVYKLQRYLS